MITVVIPAREWFDEKTWEFIQTKEYRITIEHSLVSVSKWESKWKKPFLSKKEKTREETLDYVRCMTLTQNVPDDAYKGITDSVYQQISDYINDPMTATWFPKSSQHSSNEIITSERIYSSMIQLGIPMECQKWHLNRLMTLIKVCAEDSRPKKKMSKGDIMRSNSALNAARRKASGSRG